MSAHRPILIGAPHEVQSHPPDAVNVALVDALMHLAGSSLDLAVAAKIDANFGYIGHVGAAMGVLNHLLHGFVLKNDVGDSFKYAYEYGFIQGAQAAQNLQAVLAGEDLPYLAYEEEPA